ncbi:MAG: TRAP transporter substrate-binding protein [Deltaproteobacteria bacterium]|nr:TRAP transporter substrate-binding protein [Deltaproteobacteria bacterium]
MKKWSRVFTFCLAAVLTAGYALAMELKFANYFPAPSMQSKICEEFIKDIEEKTKGKVKFRYFPGGTLLTAARMYDGVVEGLADIGLSNIEYTFGRFKATELLVLPHGFPTVWVSVHVVNDFYKKYRPKEWDGVKVLAFHTCPLYNIITVKKPVEKIEDLRGMTLRSIGIVAKTVTALGGTARTIPMAEAYDALTKGVIDGLMTPIETLETWKFAEIVKYVTEIWPIGQVNVFYLIMNKTTWEKLPPDVKKVFDEYPFVEKLALMWNEVDIRGRKYGLEKGVKFITLPDDEIKRWREKIKPVVEEYVTKMEAEGISRKESEDRMAFVRSRIEYWTKKQQEAKIKSSTGPDFLLAK